MRVGLNALALSPDRPGGDGTYVLEMARRCPTVDPSTAWVIFVAENARGLLGSLPANTSCVVCRVPGGSIIARVLWEQTALARLASRQRLDVLHAPVNVLPLAYPGPMGLTLHEAEPFKPRSAIPLPLLAWWRAMRTASARRAKQILTVSQAARADLVRWMGIGKRRIHVTYLGVDSTRFAPAPSGSPARSLLGGQPYVLWVGRPYPHKNVEVLLDAFAQLHAEGRRERLVLIGPPGWREAILLRRIEREFEPGWVIRLPATWTDLPDWYAGASAFAFPSSQETFGLPMLEAMASGTPVVAADIPALREVGGDAPVYASVGDAVPLARAVARVLDDSQLAAEHRERGSRRVAYFDWDETARETSTHLRLAAKG